jgi:hypothetical protein
MVASVASFGSPTLTQGQTAHAVVPAPVAPVPNDTAQPHAAQHVVSAVAFAPAAMSALIEAQERLSHPAPVLARDDTVHVIDQLIYRLDAGATSEDMPFEVRRLHAARVALTASPVDIKA